MQYNPVQGKKGSYGDFRKHPLAVPIIPLVPALAAVFGRETVTV